MTMLQANDVVRLRNMMDKDWQGMYNSQTYRMAPGGEAIVPYIAACNWFGHPEAVDIDPRNRYRTDEYQRLRVFYGVYDDEDRWDELTPNVEVYTLDGDRIITVIDDPTGNHLTPAQSTVAERELLLTQMTAMQRQMAIMQAQLDNQNRALAAEDNGDLVTEDPAPSNPNPHVLDPETIAKAQVNAEVGKQRQAVNQVAKQVSEDTPTRVKVSG